MPNTLESRSLNTTSVTHTGDSASYRLLGVRVDAIQIPNAVRYIIEWTRKRHGCRYVAVTGMHGVMEAQHDPEFRQILNSAGLVVPDGMPLVWMARLRGHHLERRVYGPELMLAVFESAARSRLRHFLYGGAPGIPERLAETLHKRFPGTVIAGTYSPPYRALTPGEDSQITQLINRAQPDIVWVGLSTPKQERWMHRYRHLLEAPVLIGVGAAFDINAGVKSQAPAYMREHGLEWIFRLAQEPRRLWRRYLIYGSEFLFYVSLELAGIRKTP
jgi:N-acetylglucosaminyldiphosphoundecaprenol N-acetyl-beta-D-mannosaminyltransferase